MKFSLSRRRFLPLSSLSLLLVLLSSSLSNAFEYWLVSDADPATSLSLTDVTTGISGIKTLFIDAATGVEVKDISWEPVNSTNAANDVLLWTTSVDGVQQASGNISLSTFGLILPTSLSAGEIKVTSRKKHTITVTLSMDDKSIDISQELVAIQPWISLIPLILVLILAVTTQLVEVSLFACVFVGACIVAGSLIQGFKDSLAVYLVDSLYDKDHVFVMLFTLFLSGMVGMMEKSGGMLGFTNLLGKYATSSRAGQFAVYGIGCMIFFDDYANCLLAGETMQPLTDLLMISREKLAFIVDATAAPVASISPVSSWVGFEVDLIQTEIDRIIELVGEDNLRINKTGLGVFLQSIKYRYYPIFMIMLMFCTIFFKSDYGPMLIAERKVRVYERLDGGDGKGKSSTSEDHKANQPTKGTPTLAYNMLIPIALLIALIFYLLVKTGEVPGEDQTLLNKIESGNSFTALLWGTFGATICTMIFYLLQWFNADGKIAFPPLKYFCTFLCAKEKVNHNESDDVDVDEFGGAAKPLLSIPELIDSFLHGMGRIFPALIVLTLAWAVGAIMVDVGADRLFSRWIVGGLNPDALPTLSFLISFLMALATGTSWGTMSILFPLLLVPTYQASNGDPLIFYSTTAGVLSGSVAGDHVSPISDTTVLSALACDCQLLRHVATQTPYVAFTVLLSILVGTVPIGYDAWPNLIGIFMGLLFCLLFAKFVCAPVESPTGRYDIFTELWLMVKKDPQLLELKEHTIKYFSGDVDHANGLDKYDDDPEAIGAKKINDDDDDEESDEKVPSKGYSTNDDEYASA